MKTTSSATGPGPTAGCLFLPLLLGCICSQGTDSAAIQRASISSSLICRPTLGQKLTVWCEGYTGFPESGNIYWLANSSFVDEVYPSGAVSELDPVEDVQGKGLCLKRALLFRAVSRRDLQTRFNCVVVDPASVVQKTLAWRTARVPKQVHTRGPKGSAAAGTDTPPPKQRAG